MKKPRHTNPLPNPRRRRLLTLLGLAAGATVTPRGEARPACLLSLKEADFQRRDDLAG